MEGEIEVMSIGERKTKEKIIGKEFWWDKVMDKSRQWQFKCFMNSYNGYEREFGIQKFQLSIKTWHNFIGYLLIKAYGFNFLLMNY